MSDYMVEEAAGGFVLPLGGFICTEARGDDLILRSPDGQDEAWVSAGIGDDVLSELVEREARVERSVATGDSTLEIDFDGGVSVVSAARGRCRGVGGSWPRPRPRRGAAGRRRAGHLGLDLGDSPRSSR